MHGLISGQMTSRGFLRSAFVLCSSVLLVALLITPYSVRQTGSAGVLGLAGAGAICLFAGLAADAFGIAMSRSGTPLAGLLGGIAFRMLPPLTICLVLAAQGAHGRRHLAFVGYLLAFYMVTLALETWLAVKRVSEAPTNLNHKTH
jgi:hypothetical protein